ncbi:hypothetical protein PTKIN_Ptkin12aG0094900 [Pterospermum kingtungense]
MNGTRRRWIAPQMREANNEKADSDSHSCVGDLVIILKGLSCTWDVSVAVDKHYKFKSSSSTPSSSSSSS